MTSIPTQIKGAEFSGKDYSLPNTVDTNQERTLLHLLHFFKKAHLNKYQPSDFLLLWGVGDTG